MRTRRPIEELEIVPPATGELVDRMVLLTAAGDGWINVAPRSLEDPGPPPSLLAAMFGPSRSTVTMCTWMPPGSGRRVGAGATVGIAHPGGGTAVRRLASLGVPLPDGWRVRQDHVRRGLVVDTTSDAAHSDVIDWALRAGAALAPGPLTGRWLARVHLPVRS
ncbi:MAG: hypothetical protein ACRDY3_00960 [Acidimicrobiales bacterium]